MLGQRKQRIYLNISEGKIVRRTDRGQEKYDYVVGTLEKIHQRDREFRGEKVPYWYIDLRDRKTGDLYTLGLGASSGVWRSIILSLGSIQDLSLPVRIEPYKRGEFDRVSVYSGEERQDWVSGLPPIEEVEVGGKKIKSVDKREAFFLQIVDRINASLGEKG